MTETAKTCFVIMPFDRRLTELYERAIVPALSAVGLEAARHDDLLMHESLNPYARSAITAAVLVIADLSVQEANVFFEMGIAHALGKPIVILSQDTSNVPFDLKHYRIFTYRLGDIKTYSRLRAQLEQAIRVIVNEQLNRGETKGAAEQNAAYPLKRLEDVLEQVKKAQGEGKHREAAALLEEEIGKYLRSEDQSATALLYNNLGTIYQNLGEYQKALYNHQAALDLLQASGKVNAEAVTLGNLANVFESLGNVEQAEGFYRRALDLSVRLSDDNLRASLLNNLGLLFSRQRRFAEAEDAYRDALVHFQQTDDRASLASTYGNLASLRYSLADVGEAERLFNMAISEFERLGDKSNLARSLHNLAIVEQGAGKNDTAEGYLRKSLAIKEEIGDQAGIAASLVGLGSIYRGKGDPEGAISSFVRAGKIQQEIGDRYGLLRSFADLASILESSQDSELKQIATTLLERALDIANEIQAPERAEIERRLALSKTNSASSLIKSDPGAKPQ
jgi:tetratricopeptide (TPR) repeat protein